MCFYHEKKKKKKNNFLDLFVILHRYTITFIFEWTTYLFLSFISLFAMPVNLSYTNDNLYNFCGMSVELGLNEPLSMLLNSPTFIEKSVS